MYVFLTSKQRELLYVCMYICMYILCNNISLKPLQDLFLPRQSFSLLLFYFIRSLGNFLFSSGRSGVVPGVVGRERFFLCWLLYIYRYMLYKHPYKYSGVTKVKYAFFFRPRIFKIFTSSKIPPPSLKNDCEPKKKNKKTSRVEHSPQKRARIIIKYGMGATAKAVGRAKGFFAGVIRGILKCYKHQNKGQHLKQINHPRKIFPKDKKYILRLINLNPFISNMAFFTATGLMVNIRVKL